MLGSQYIYIDNLHKIRQPTYLLDFMYFMDVNILGSQRVRSIFRLNLLEGLKMTV